MELTHTYPVRSNSLVLREHYTARKEFTLLQAQCGVLDAKHFLLEEMESHDGT
jgi:hypothetical protein